MYPLQLDEVIIVTANVMSSSSISPYLLEQLHQRASQAGYSTDDYLSRLLSPQPAKGIIPDAHKEIFEMVTDAVMICEPNGKFIYCNQKALDRLGYTLDEILHMNPADIVHPDYHAISKANHERVWAGETVMAESAHRTKDGRMIPVELHAHRAQYNGDSVTIAIVRNIHERKQFEIELRQNEERLRSLIESQTAYVIRTDIEGNYTYINDAFFKRFCWTYEKKSDLIGLSCMNTIYADDHAKTLETVTACIKDMGAPKQVILRKSNRDGSTFSTLWEFVALSNEAGIFSEMQCIGVDITELLNIRQQLQLQENALQAAANAIVIASCHGFIEWANPAFTTLTGYTFEEVKGKRTNLLKSGVHDQAFYTTMWNTVLSGDVWQGRMVNRRKDGSLYTEEQTITPVRDMNGSITHFIAIKLDVSERVQAEQIRLEQERLKNSLKKAEEFNALVRKAVSALSHDVRTPLAVIDATRETLDYYFDRLDEEKRREKLGVISKQLRYVLELLNDVTLTVKSGLSYSEFKCTAVNLPALCQLSISEIQQTSGSMHNLRFVSDGYIQTAWIDETLVSRILLNLLSNAVKFSPAGGHVSLELGQRDAWIVLRVIDHGLGISEADIPHIFEPFYRSTSVHSIGGTGLGLNIVKDCVDRHEGHIDVTSQVGNGTTFTIELPLKLETCL